MAQTFNPAERRALAIVESDLPDSLTPFADIAQACGMTEAEVLGLLQRLRETGAIRRFGASIRHQRAGWGHNAMVAWAATREQADACALDLTANQFVSHAYFRPASAPDWPYTFYTMVHGRSEAECANVIAGLATSWPDLEYAVLRSQRELKKTSMIYFGAADDG
ncbi:MAG: Lrp/AsnC family transcriptional regulator [Desulfovibrio sp.]|nr:Lrp/AsnC family transcriptional regulator [Desulfovibrio sp.]